MMAYRNAHVAGAGICEPRFTTIVIQCVIYYVDVYKRQGIYWNWVSQAFIKKLKARTHTYTHDSIFGPLGLGNFDLYRVL